MKYKIILVLVWVFSNLNAQTQAELSLRKTVASFNSDTADLFAKRDTNKFANDIRASIESFSSNSYKQMIADSCYSTVVNSFTVNNGSIESVIVTYDKTIPNTRVQVTPVFTTQITAGLGDFVWYAHNITSSQLEISVHNNAATGLISIGFDVRVCPNGY